MTMPDIAHQKLIKDKMAEEDAWNLFGEWWKDIDVDIKKAIIKPIDFKTASNLIKRYEWLQCMPAMVKYCFGIYFDDNLGGAVVYSTEYIENLGHWDKYDYTNKIILSCRYNHIYPNDLNFLYIRCYKQQHLQDCHQNKYQNNT